MNARNLAPLALLVVPAFAAVYFALARRADTVPEPARQSRAPSGATAAPVDEPPAPPPVAPAPSAAAPASDEAAGLAEIESLLTTDPERALALVREQNEKYPGGELHDDRDYAGVRAWVNLGKIAKARDMSTEFYLAHPKSPLVQRVHQLTGMHLPPRVGPVAP